ncbi:MAG: 6-phosphofructokinase [candidate division NC10 bacterium]|jgi:6-phosphofructokinase 1|nr:6-phosphofructokinase [candidate division NC10 bacterium]
MTTQPKRIAIANGGGFVPGLNAVVTGAARAAQELGWELVGIRDGFDGLLHPDRYPAGGLVPLSAPLVEHLSGTAGPVLGAGARLDPFHVRTVTADNSVEETDRSDALLQALRKEAFNAVIAIVDTHALNVVFKLSRKGLRAVCVPKSAENQIAATHLSFGFNSVLSFAVDMLDRARQAAEAVGKIGVVEVLGEHAGWLALQAGTAVCADAILIPEIPYDLAKVAEKLRKKPQAGRPYGLVVVAEGAAPTAGQLATLPVNPVRASLSPGATGHEGGQVIDPSGQVAATVASQLQRLTDQETYPLTLGALVKAGAPTAVDRQLGLAYGAAAVRALQEGQAGVLIAFQPPELKFVPLVEAINKIRTVPGDSVFIQAARSLGISLGD